MHTTDHDAFVKLLDEQAAVFGKPKPDDSMVQSYWRALKDLSFGTVREMGAKHMRYGKFFPKPYELRPKDDKPAIEQTNDGKFEEALKWNAHCWEQLKREDPETYKSRLFEAVRARQEAKGQM